MYTPIAIIIGSLIVALGAYQGLSHAYIDKRTDARTYHIDHTDTVEVFGLGIGHDTSNSTISGSTVVMTGSVTITNAGRIVGDVTEIASKK